MRFLLASVLPGANRKLELAVWFSQAGGHVLCSCGSVRYLLLFIDVHFDKYFFSAAVDVDHHFSSPRAGVFGKVYVDRRTSEPINEYTTY